MLVIFFSNKTIAPARKPAKIPPKKPETVFPPLAPWNAKFSMNFENPYVLEDFSFAKNIHIFDLLVLVYREWAFVNKNLKI